jgi:hypothetical protein
MKVNIARGISRYVKERMTVYEGLELDVSRLRRMECHFDELGVFYVKFYDGYGKLLEGLLGASFECGNMREFLEGISWRVEEFVYCGEGENIEITEDEFLSFF